MNTEHWWNDTRETEVLGEKLFQCNFVIAVSHVNYHGVRRVRKPR
jgi:hypothetical protein